MSVEFSFVLFGHFRNISVDFSYFGHFRNITVKFSFVLFGHFRNIFVEFSSFWPFWYFILIIKNPQRKLASIWGKNKRELKNYANSLKKNPNKTTGKDLLKLIICHKWVWFPRNGLFQGIIGLLKVPWQLLCCQWCGCSSVSKSSAVCSPAQPWEPGQLCVAPLSQGSSTLPPSLPLLVHSKGHSSWKEIFALCVQAWQKKSKPCILQRV